MESSFHTVLRQYKQFLQSKGWLEGAIENRLDELIDLVSAGAPQTNPELSVVLHTALDNPAVPGE